MTVSVIFFSVSVFTQSTPINSINAQLRALFEDLDKPTPPLNFLYDMSAKMSDSVFYATNNTTDTLTSEMWQMIYGEMYHAAYDTLSYTYPDTVFAHSHNFYSDTIPMGIMRYSFYKFKNNALTTNVYFDFDTINTVLTEHYPSGQWPYQNKALFVAAPLIGTCDYSNPIFRVDPEFLFMDASYLNGLAQGSYILKIDFGDGLGWITFNTTTITHHQVDYPTGGEKLIKSAIYTSGGTLTNYSQSRLIVGSIPSLPPDETWDMPGMTVGIYSGCEHDINSGRLVIYLEGFDVTDPIPAWNRTVTDIYTGMISDDIIVQLKNDGYNFLVVDWKSSTTDLRFNALYLVNLLEYLKSITTDDEQFIIMGESMGGLIARYALTFMETQQYQSETFTGFFQDATDINNIGYLLLHPGIYDLPSTIGEKDKMHNTRLLITLDSPHQGANIPLSYQHAYREALYTLSLYMGLDLQFAANILNLGLDAQAAQQMLIYHIDTKSGLGLYKSYTSLPDKTTFFTQLYNMGDYPEYAKVVSMSNGSLYGKPQINEYTGNARTSGDDLIDIEADLYARVLGIKVPIYGGDFECNTSPNGNGHLYQANAGNFGINIKLYWFGVKITWGYNSLFSTDEYANTLPVCTSPGGTILPGYAVGTESFYAGFNWFLISADSYNTGLGCYVLDTHLGIDGLASVNFDLSVCSDGLGFSFIPVQSALDYGPSFGYYSLFTNIETQAIGTKLNRVKADVIIGIPGDVSTANKSHLYLKNDDIPNLTGNTTTPAPFEHTYYTCDQAGINEVERGFLNLEIGDEELYLENVTLPWYGKYQTEYNIRVNKRNPHYEYVGYLNGTYNVLGIYSKKDPFIIQSPGHAEFHYDATGTPVTPAFQYGSPTSTDTTRVNEPLYICCTDYLETRLTDEHPQQHEEVFDVESFLSVYPNPNNGSEVTLDFKFQSSDQPVQISVYNTLGIEVYQAVSDRNKRQATLNLSFLAPGVYIIVVSDNLMQLSNKLLIVK